MPDVPLAEHKEMDARADLADEFFAITSAEVRPFVSDEANWYDFDYEDSDRLIEVVKIHYGVILDETLLRMPFWRLLDYLNTRRGAQR
ncbi:MAG TPA: hypothetical protein VN193_13205 [Candidatus Angelobacter sp.]|nr:hypothetical protein [Candidatus Angelobacter sp.]